MNWRIYVDRYDRKIASLRIENSIYDLTYITYIMKRCSLVSPMQSKALK